MFTSQFYPHALQRWKPPSGWKFQQANSTVKKKIAKTYFCSSRMNMISYRSREKATIIWERRQQEPLTANLWRLRELQAKRWVRLEGEAGSRKLHQESKQRNRGFRMQESSQGVYHSNHEHTTMHCIIPILCVDYESYPLTSFCNSIKNLNITQSRKLHK